MSTNHPSDAPSGLGGWLILVGIGLIISPFQTLFILITIYVPMFNDGTIAYLTDPTTPVYNPFWGPYIYGEIAVNIFVFLFSIWLITLFFTKNHRLPSHYIFFRFFLLIFIFVDASLITVVVPDEQVFSPDTVREIATNIIGIAIWVPYMLVSKRVKATFVNKSKSEEEEIVSRF